MTPILFGEKLSSWRIYGLCQNKALTLVTNCFFFIFIFVQFITFLSYWRVKNLASRGTFWSLGHQLPLFIMKCSIYCFSLLVISLNGVMCKFWVWRWWNQSLLWQCHATLIYWNNPFFDFKEYYHLLRQHPFVTQTLNCKGVTWEIRSPVCVPTKCIIGASLWK